MGYRDELYRKRVVHSVPLVQPYGREIEPSLADHQAPRTVAREVLRHRRRAVTWCPRDTEALSTQERQAEVVTDVGVGEKYAVERSPGLRTPPKRFAGNEVELPREVRCGVDEIIPLRIGVDQCQRGYVVGIASGGLTARCVASGLWQAAVLHRSQHQREHLRLRGGGGGGGEPVPAGSGHRGGHELSARCHHWVFRVTVSFQVSGFKLKPST